MGTVTILADGLAELIERGRPTGIVVYRDQWTFVVAAEWQTGDRREPTDAMTDLYVTGYQAIAEEKATEFSSVFGLEVRKELLMV